MYKLLIISTKYNSISGCAPVEELQMQIDYLQKFNYCWIPLNMNWKKYYLKMTFLLHIRQLCLVTTKKRTIYYLMTIILFKSWNIIK